MLFIVISVSFGNICWIWIKPENGHSGLMQVFLIQAYSGLFMYM